PEMVYESGRVKIKAPIAANADFGPIAVKVQADTPSTMSGVFSSPEINGELELGRRKYKYSAKVEFKVEVTWHPRPYSKGPEPVAETVREVSSQAKKNMKAEIPPNQHAHATKWDQTVAEKGVVIAVASLIFYVAYRSVEIFARRGMMVPVTVPPFIHNVGRPDSSGDA
ncbi:MAG: hypothetical protein KJP07_09470, partial [Desulfatitalea sp.]|nr:hypothetical protein [Desulfatitalea sp.]